MDNTYFSTQASALQHVEDNLDSRYEIAYPDRIWSEHVNYGTTVKYHFPLIVKKTGNMARKWLNISLYRMGSGSYELTQYIN